MPSKPNAYPEQLHTYTTKPFAATVRKRAKQAQVSVAALIRLALAAYLGLSGCSSSAAAAMLGEEVCRVLPPPRGRQARNRQ